MKYLPSIYSGRHWNRLEVKSITFLINSVIPSGARKTIFRKYVNEQFHGNKPVHVPREDILHLHIHIRLSAIISISYHNEFHREIDTRVTNLLHYHPGTSIISDTIIEIKGAWFTLESLIKSDAIVELTEMLNRINHARMQLEIYTDIEEILYKILYYIFYLFIYENLANLQFNS